jgi:hypothetical protein
MSLYDLITCCKWVKISAKKKTKKDKQKVDTNASFEIQNESFQNPNTSFESQTTDVSGILAELDSPEDKRTSTKLGKNIYLFLKDYPLYDTYALRIMIKSSQILLVLLYLVMIRETENYTAQPCWHFFAPGIQVKT